MKYQRSLIVLFAGLALAGAAPFPSMAQDSRLAAASYDGTWAGQLKCLYDPGLWPEDECDIGLTMDISGKITRLEQVVRSKKGKETKADIDPAKFQFSALRTNAVATSMDAGKDEDGNWVETWSFVMTLKDPDHMVVHWTRVVNNVDMPLARKGSKFSIVGMGELVRQKK